MQSILEHHLPPCLSHITVEYLSGTREHWADVFKTMVLPHFAVASRSRHLFHHRMLNVGWFKTPKNVHDRKERLMYLIDGRMGTRDFKVPSCREFSLTHTTRRNLRFSFTISTILCTAQSKLEPAQVWDILLQDWDPQVMMDDLLMDHEHFSTFSCPGWALDCDANSNEHHLLGWCVTVCGHDRWLSALKNARTRVSNRS